MDRLLSLFKSEDKTATKVELFIESSGFSPDSKYKNT